jgi:ATP-dependent helicase HepA
MQPIPGQRWTSDTEPELGLGTVVACEGRTVTLLFLAVAERRTYAIANMPLSRVSFGIGDRIEQHEGWHLTITRVEEQAGLLTYHGDRDDGSSASLPEGELSNFIQFNRPLDRLFAGQMDPPHWFDLRLQTLQHLNRLEQSPAWGLSGVRTSLLPHQLYIAHEVASRHAPRVLLADEVGLGKTIEACLILHHQLLTGRAQRALIIVPETLIHQWLVELLRRFNLHFSIYDEQRCSAIEKSGQAENPFHAEQLVLCSLGLFTRSPQRHKQVLTGEWDLLIVDEAHHLEWSEAHASAEYQIVEQLAAQTRGVLLLTATPEQLGRAGHFARLRLLDPDRFYDLQAFQQEESRYAPVANAAERLLNNGTLPEADCRQLLLALGEADAGPLLESLNDPQTAPAQQAAARQQLIDMLLDRHGTGRVLFRNTRKRVKGFPKRKLQSSPLPLPAAYREALEALARRDSAQANPQLLAQAQLIPEAVYQSQASPQASPWWQFDPRIDWLLQTLRTLRKKKLLLICTQAQTAIDLELALRTREGIHGALFHEQMTIIERDRAAAWFADRDEGAQLLICSEIGSEGRNFQFAHHLVLFDLPPDPDLLEQRIGRLDRIGQHETIQIHAPYLKGSAQEIQLRWLHEGLNAFESTCPAGHIIYSQKGPALLQAIEHQATEHDPAEIDTLIEDTRQLHAEADHALQQGRDHLLELSSCREQAANALRQEISHIDQDPSLESYMGELLDCYGVDMEEHSSSSHILRPTPQMRCDSFPGLSAEGLTGTFQRNTALSHEDWQFFTWEHPLVRDAMEMLQDDGSGNCAVTTIEHPSITPGSPLLEALFLLKSIAPKALRAGRFLPPTPIRLVLDLEGGELGSLLPPGLMARNALAIDRNAAAQLVRHQKDGIREMLAQAETLATRQTAPLIKAAQGKLLEDYSRELRRLAALQQVNPNIRDEEIEALKGELRTLNQHLQSAHLRLDAIRLIVTC